MAKKKILIVDDEEDFGKMVKINLEGTGHYDVQVEKQGSKAVETAKAFGPDLILLDIMMRDLAGPAVAQLIRSEAQFKATPIIFLSAAVPKQESESPTDLIAGHPYMAKPVDTPNLIRFLQKYLPN